MDLTLCIEALGRTHIFDTCQKLKRCIAVSESYTFRAALYKLYLQRDANTPIASS